MNAPSWALLKGWCAVEAARRLHPEDYARRHRNAPYQMTLDGACFAPLRLVYELGLGAPYPPEDNFGKDFKSLAKDMEAQGWQRITDTDPAFEALYTAFATDCTRLDPKGTPGCFHHPSDPRIGRVFMLPQGI
ncbi:hypothetical protein [Salipiger abyssi]|uniref:hypothetical protein n=1 Tax=Salipiger abyssi TaxID=1250539 RepID=UPI001A908172|nr:hypothetical protein [Salipiger abyssi]MBN9887348.1 hypothetical protein [Salipiger abyssi]